jgi:hypothetical protein
MKYCPDVVKPVSTSKLIAFIINMTFPSIPAIIANECTGHKYY